METSSTHYIFLRIRIKNTDPKKKKKLKRDQTENKIKLIFVISNEEPFFEEIGSNKGKNNSRSYI